MMIFKTFLAIEMPVSHISGATWWKPYCLPLFVVEPKFICRSVVLFLF